LDLGDAAVEKAKVLLGLFGGRGSPVRLAVRLLVLVLLLLVLGSLLQDGCVFID
jgi:hypothetical protein